MTILILMAVLIVSRFPQPLAAAAATTKDGSNHLIEEACRHSPHKESCVAALESDPNSKVSDLKGLAMVAIKLASTNASDTAEHLKVLLNDESLDPAVQDGVSECLEHYLDAAEQLDDSTAALLADAPKDVRTWVEVAVTDADSCDSALEGESTSLMASKNEAFRRLCGYALAVNKLLETKLN